MKRVTVRVPASSANLGSGFDCVGVALRLHHTLTVEEEEGSGFEIRVSGEGARAIPVDESNATYKAMTRMFAHTGHSPGRLIVESVNEIPLSAGLGSSAASVLAGMAAAAVLSGQEIDWNQLLRLAVDVEGHPDNVAAALYGGFAVVCRTGSQSVEHLHVPIPPSLSATVVHPEFTVSTDKSRDALPDSVSFADAVFNVSRAALLVGAFATSRTELIQSAMQDRLHQPHRMQLVPGLEEVCQAALDAGAHGAALSGSGPSVMAFVRKGDSAPGARMRAAWAREGVQARVLELEFDHAGLQLLEGITE